MALIDACQGVTRNYVELPTAVKQGALHIKISGKVELSLTLQVGKSESQTYVLNPACLYTLIPICLTARAPR